MTCRAQERSGRKIKEIRTKMEKAQKPRDTDENTVRDTQNGHTAKKKKERIETKKIFLIKEKIIYI